MALLCVYGIGTRIAGRIFGYWAAALWVVIPYAAIPMFDPRYHEKFVSITLPQSLGLTVLADFPSTVFILLTAYLIVRAVDTNDWTDAVLAGLVGGFVIGLKPSNSLFLEPPSSASWPHGAGCRPGCSWPRWSRASCSWRSGSSEGSANCRRSRRRAGAATWPRSAGT